MKDVNGKTCRRAAAGHHIALVGTVVGLTAHVIESAKDSKPDASVVLVSTGKTEARKVEKCGADAGKNVVSPLLSEYCLTPSPQRDPWAATLRSPLKGM